MKPVAETQPFPGGVQPGPGFVAKLTEPYVAGFEFLLGIIHHMYDFVPELSETDRIMNHSDNHGDFPSSMLVPIYQLVFTAHYYSVTHLLRPWVAGWVEALKGPSREPTKRYIYPWRLLIGWLLGNEALIDQSLDIPVFISWRDHLDRPAFVAARFEPDIPPDGHASNLLTKSIYGAIPGVQAFVEEKRLQMMNAYRNQLLQPVFEDYILGGSPHLFRCTATAALDNGECDASLFGTLAIELFSAGVFRFDETGNKLAVKDLYDKLLNPVPIQNMQLESRGVHHACVVKWKERVKDIWENTLPPQSIRLTEEQRAILARHREMVRSPPVTGA